MKNTNLTHMTNTEFLTELMEGSMHVYGAMGQLVIIQALQKGLQTMHNGKEELLAQHQQDEKEGRISFINIPIWVEATEEILNKFNEKYGNS